MINRIHLQNFKASRDVNVRLAPLTILAGLNGSGKSSLLQAIGLLRQSYSDNKRQITELSLAGVLLQLGKYIDVLSEGSNNDSISIKVCENEEEYQWVYSDKDRREFIEF